VVTRRILPSLPLLLLKRTHKGLPALQPALHGVTMMRLLTNGTLSINLRGNCLACPNYGFRTEDVCVKLRCAALEELQLRLARFIASAGLKRANRASTHHERSFPKLSK